MSEQKKMCVHVSEVWCGKLCTLHVQWYLLQNQLNFCSNWSKNYIIQSGTIDSNLFKRSLSCYLSHHKYTYAYGRSHTQAIQNRAANELQPLKYAQLIKLLHTVFLTYLPTKMELFIKAIEMCSLFNVDHGYRNDFRNCHYMPLYYCEIHQKNVIIFCWHVL